MGLKLILRAHFVSTALLVVALSVPFALPAASQGLSDDTRALLLKILFEGCLKSTAADPNSAELPTAALRSSCLCSATYIAARVTPKQLDKPESLSLRALIAEATRNCLPRKKPA